MLWDAVLAKRAAKASRIDRVEKFRGAVKELAQLDSIQKRFINKLVKLLEVRLNASTPTPEERYEYFIVENYGTFTEAELDLFVTIKGITANSMKRQTDDLLTWIDQNTEFKNNTISTIQTKSGFEFSRNIVKLELHLNVWQDKYSVWMTNDKHAFIRIDEEESILKLLAVLEENAASVVEDLQNDKHLLKTNNPTA